MKPKAVILCSKQPATCPYPEAYESSRLPPILLFLRSFVFRYPFIYHYIFQVVFFLQGSPTWGTAAKVYGICFPFQPISVTRLPPWPNPTKMSLRAILLVLDAQSTYQVKWLSSHGQTIRAKCWVDTSCIKCSLFITVPLGNSGQQQIVRHIHAVLAVHWISNLPHNHRVI
jgi:hypothetical protein